MNYLPIDIHINYLLNQSLTLINEFQGLIDSFVTDYFLHCDSNHYNPSHWHATVKDLELDDLMYLLSNTSQQIVNPKRVLPLWLLSYRAACHSTCLNHHPEGRPLFTCNELHQALTIDNCTDSNDRLPNALRKHINPKKEHEILRQAKVIHALSDVCKTRKVVDVGAGQGHLSRLLSLGFHLDVTCLEGSSCHAPRATKYDNEAMTVLEKQLLRTADQRNLGNNSSSVSLPQHLTAYIDAETSSTDFKELFAALSTVDDLSAREATHPNNTFLLTGLHACGDLTTTILRLFSQLSSVRGLVTVGCCYMRMKGATEDPHTSATQGFPLSKHLQGLNTKFTYQALEMATHCVSGYLSKLAQAKSADPLSRNPLTVHAYRAALQEVITKRSVMPDISRANVKCSVKNTHLLTFKDYASIGLSRFGFDPELSEEEVLLGEQRIDSQWMDVVRFHVLRLMLAPTVETVLLLDRLVFLRDQGLLCGIIPLFDASISPRNIAIVALKA